MHKAGLILLALSLLVGAAALWGLRTLTGTEARAAPTPALAHTTVLVAARPIGFGEAITPAALRLQPWPAGALPAGAFRNAAELGSQPRYALAAMAANEPLLRQKITGWGGRASLSGMIRPGQRASTIRVDDVVGVAGFVLPGDTVDVLVTRKEGREQPVMRADVLLRGVRVLAVDQVASPDKDDPMVVKAATLEVSPEQAQKIALASQVGALSLALRGAEDPNAPPPPARTVREADLTLAATAPAPRPRHARPALRTLPTLQVYRGSIPQMVAVRRE